MKGLNQKVSKGSKREENNEMENMLDRVRGKLVFLRIIRS